MNFRAALLKTGSITFDSTGEYIIVSNDVLIDDDEDCNTPYNSNDETCNYDEIDNNISESWD